MLRPLAAIVPCQSTCLPHQHFLTAPAVPHKYMLSNKYCAVYNNWHTHIYRSLEIHVLRYAYDVKYINSVLNIISSNFARLWTKIQLSLSSVNLGIFHCALIVQILSCSWFSYSESKWIDYFQDRNQGSSKYDTQLCNYALDARTGGSMIGYPTRLSTIYATSTEQSI